MSHYEAHYVPDGRDAFSCLLSADGEARLTATGTMPDDKPKLAGSRTLKSNKTVVENLWAFGKHEFLFRRARASDKRKSHQAQASRHANMAAAVADMVDRLGDSERKAWCSACFSWSVHRRVEGWGTVPAAYLCTGCGSPTTPCAAVSCPNMANRGLHRGGVPRYCAEHRHDIAGFDRLHERLESIDDYGELLNFNRRDLAKATRIAIVTGVAAAVVAPASFVAAPAIGAAIGSSALGGELVGAAAVSHGLAMLGGGSLAAGGFGMAGGTVVVVAAGAALGGAGGLATSSAYLRDDKSFDIRLLRDGRGTPVLLASGFLTEGDDGWGPWQRLVDQRYPGRPVYRVFWGSKELKALAGVTAVGVGKAAATKYVAGVAARGTQAGARTVPFLGSLLLANDVAANPWSRAKVRATMTGGLLADLIARTSNGRFVLVGHSLGARVMLTAARSLGTLHAAPRLEAVHLLGTAVSADGDWRTLNDSVEEHVWNYYSAGDWVLRYLYPTAHLGNAAVGVVGLSSTFPKLSDVNVSRRVRSHSGYFTGAVLR
jgi:pimeloyl-ACP methyl ester carboxylesterase